MMSGETIQASPACSCRAAGRGDEEYGGGWVGPIVLSKTFLAVWRKVGAPIEASFIKATRGRLKLSPNLPMVVLTSMGARSGERRDVLLAYFTDGDDVVLIASNYSGKRHPAWYHNLRAQPECQLHIGPRGGWFLAKEAVGADRIDCISSPLTVSVMYLRCTTGEVVRGDDPGHAADACRGSALAVKYEPLRTEGEQFSRASFGSAAMVFV